MNEAVTKSDIFLIRIFQSTYIGYTVTKSLSCVFFRVYLKHEQMKTPYLSNYNMQLRNANFHHNQPKLCNIFLFLFSIQVMYVFIICLTAYSEILKSHRSFKTIKDRVPFLFSPMYHVFTLLIELYKKHCSFLHKDFHKFFIVSINA